jgi:thioredoxin reductase (NADPH)
MNPRSHMSWRAQWHESKRNFFTARQGVQLYGVYSCGDVDRHYFKEITAASEGCIDGLGVEIRG